MKHSLKTLLQSYKIINRLLNLIIMRPVLKTLLKCYKITDRLNYIIMKPVLKYYYNLTKLQIDC